MFNLNKNRLLEKYRNTVGSDSAKARDIIKQLDYKEDYYLLNCIAQTYLDESRFWEDDTMRDHLDNRKLRYAERYVIKAFTINPDSSEVLYTMGEIRKLFGQEDIAIYCFEKILKTKLKDIGSGMYGRGLGFARELTNDSKFELYRLYYESDPVLSKKYLKMYKDGLKKGITTIFKPLDKFLLD